MAWLEKRGECFHVCFRLGERKFKWSLKTTNPREAVIAVSRAERRWKLVEDGDVSIPDGADLATCIVSDGKLDRPVVVQAISLRELLVNYERSLKPGTLDSNTIDTIRRHLKHLSRILGPKLRADRLTYSDLQDDVDVRSWEMGKRGRTVSAVTVKKERAQHCSARFLRRACDRLTLAHGHATQNRNARRSGRTERARQTLSG